MLRCVDSEGKMLQRETIFKAPICQPISTKAQPLWQGAARWPDVTWQGRGFRQGRSRGVWAALIGVSRWCFLASSRMLCFCAGSRNDLPG